MRDNAINIKREAKMLEECKVIERIKENKKMMYNMGLDQKDQQLQVSWSFMKW